MSDKSMTKHMNIGDIYVDKDGCEQIFSKHQPTFPHPKDKYNIFMEGSNRVLICGISSSGKSFLLLKLVPMLANVKRIIIATTILNNPAHMALEQYCVKNNIDFILLMDPGEVLLCLSQLIVNKPENEHVLCILDDFSDSSMNKSGIYHQINAKLFCKFRNYLISCICISTSYTFFPTIIRNSANLKILFKINDIHSVRQYRYDLQNQWVDLPKELYEELYNKVSNIRYSFILWKSGINPELRFMFDELVYPIKNTSNSSGGSIDNSLKLMQISESPTQAVLRKQIIQLIERDKQEPSASLKACLFERIQLWHTLKYNKTILNKILDAYD
jgi:hypothetical protein